ncbi:MAG: anti-sigma factor antagonist [Lachnospiraceae bacterium]|nr:anti-sigma factor antagonist [Lachnospiraceae bacterium]
MEKKMEEYAIIDNYLCIRMPGEVDHHGAANIRECADRLILDDKVKNIVFDFEDTTFMDSSGLGIIIGRYRKISCFGGKVYAINTNERISRLLKASGMSAIIEIVASSQK